MSQGQARTPRTSLSTPSLSRRNSPHARPETDSFPFPLSSSALSREDITTRLLAEEAEEDDEEPTGGKRRVDSPDGGAGEGLSPLDETLEKIGMGRYQKSLLVLCGFGWMADNMWLQCVAVILPRVQEHYDVSDRWIGLLSASIFAGMMVGAWGWGSYSDAQGRTPAFNFTLLLTSVFGLLSAFAPSFPWLCAALFGLGTGVGGSMPTDGTLFLENVPPTQHYLLTALSAFFSLGAVLTSLLGLLIIPRYSCPEHPLPDSPPCDVDVENLGWRYMLGSLAVVSITFFICRILFFRLQESAKYLVSAGRPSEAIIALQRISRINGDEAVVWSLADVGDSKETTTTPTRTPTSARSREGSIRRESLGGAGDYGTPSPGSSGRGGGGGSRRESIVTVDLNEDGRGSEVEEEESYGAGMRRARFEGREWVQRLPRGLRGSVEEYLVRLDGLFEPKWATTTKLVWTIWAFASAGYTIFNVFLPKYLEQKVGEVAGDGGREQSLRDYVLYTVSGMPGSLLGAYLIETSWGRRGTMAISTVATSLATFVFVLVSSQAGVVVSSMVVSLAATLMYAVIYSYTPEVFSPAIRGTASGIASALSRLAGIIAPILTGLMLSIHVSLPLFVSAACFAVTAACMVMLPIETRGGPKVVGVGH